MNSTNSHQPRCVLPFAFHCTRILTAPGPCLLRYTTARIALVLAAIGILASRLSHAHTTCTKITTGEIVNDLGVYTRPVWADFNNRGRLDLFVSGFLDHKNVFYTNNG